MIKTVEILTNIKLKISEAADENYWGHLYVDEESSLLICVSKDKVKCLNELHEYGKSRNLLLTLYKNKLQLIIDLDTSDTKDKIRLWQ